MLFERLAGVLLDKLLNDVGAHLVAEHALEHIARRAPGAKTFDLNAAAQFVVGLVELAVDFLEFEFDRHLAPEL